MKFETGYYSSGYTLLVGNSSIGSVVKYFDLNLPSGIIPGQAIAGVLKETDALIQTAADFNNGDTPVSTDY